MAITASTARCFGSGSSCGRAASAFRRNSLQSITGLAVRICSGYICQQRWRGGSYRSARGRNASYHDRALLACGFLNKRRCAYQCGRLKRAALNGRSLPAYRVCFLQQHHAVRRGWPLRHRRRVALDPARPAAARQARCGGILCSR